MKNLICIITFCLSMPCFAQLKGKVVAIHDGDTFTLLTDSNRQVKVRLNAIDCPELKQPFGTAARKYASEKIFLKQVKVKSAGTDKYRRVLGTVFYNDTSCLNDDLIAAGYAWHYIKYDKSLRLDSFENMARKDRLGLWSDAQSQSPWDYRKNARKARQTSISNIH